MLTKRELIFFCATIAVAGCLIAAGIFIYPDSRVASEMSADVQAARYINRNH